VTGFIPPGSEGVGSISPPDGGVDEPVLFGPPKIEAKNPKNMSTMDAGCADGGGVLVITGVPTGVTAGSPPDSGTAVCRGVCTFSIVVISFGVFGIVTSVTGVAIPIGTGGAVPARPIGLFCRKQYNTEGLSLDTAAPVPHDVSESRV
jgi:hypothetical protein